MMIVTTTIEIPLSQSGVLLKDSHPDKRFAKGSEKELAADADVKNPARVTPI